MVQNQIRDSNGRFVEMSSVESSKGVSFLISEFEARMIGNRLAEASRVFSEANMNQECLWWASRFRNKCMGRENDSEYYEKGKKRHRDAVYPIKVKLTEFEAWSLGNRLWGIAEKYEERNEDEIAKECKWMARRFHAERDVMKDD